MFNFWGSLQTGVCFLLRVHARMYLIRSGGACVGVRLITLASRLLTLLLFDCSGFLNFLESLEQRRNIGFIGVVSNRYRLGVEVANNVLHAFLKRDILHDFVNTALAVDVYRKNNNLFVCLSEQRSTEYGIQNIDK